MSLGIYAFRGAINVMLSYYQQKPRKLVFNENIY